MQRSTHGLQAAAPYSRSREVSAPAADRCSGSLCESVTVRTVLLTETSEENVLVFSFDRESMSAELTR
eukprot:2236438-Pleurochrysis_carterae.AAC.1